MLARRLTGDLALLRGIDQRPMMPTQPTLGRVGHNLDRGVHQATVSVAYTSDRQHHALQEAVMVPRDGIALAALPRPPSDANPR